MVPRPVDRLCTWLGQVRYIKTAYRADLTRKKRPVIAGRDAFLRRSPDLKKTGMGNSEPRVDTTLLYIHPIQGSCAAHTRGRWKFLNIPLPHKHLIIPRGFGRCKHFFKQTHERVERLSRKEAICLFPGVILVHSADEVIGDGYLFRHTWQGRGGRLAARPAGADGATYQEAFFTPGIWPL